MDNAIDQLKIWLNQLGGFYLDSNNRCSLNAANGLTINIFCPADSQRFYIDGPLATVNNDNKEAIYELALGLNYRNEKTQGASIALNHTNNALTLCYNQKFEHCTFQEFSNIIQNTLALAESISQQLNTTQEKSAIHEKTILTHESMIKI